VIDTIDCAQARISLGAYVLGALEPAERGAVDAHLATCEGCRVELAEIADLPALLASLSEAAVAALADGWPQEWATPTGPTDTPAAPGAAGRPGDLSAIQERLKPFHTRRVIQAAGRNAGQLPLRWSSQTS
jgi:anti-sigma factor RsiW